MAEFCWDCIEKLGIEGKQNDFYEADNPDLPRESVSQVLCEGCGFIIVDVFGKRVKGDNDGRSSL